MGETDPMILARWYAHRAESGTFAEGLTRIADEIQALRAVIAQAIELGVLADDLGQIRFFHDDIDATPAVHADVLRRLFFGGDDDGA